MSRRIRGKNMPLGSAPGKRSAHPNTGAWACLVAYLFLASFLPAQKVTDSAPAVPESGLNTRVVTIPDGTPVEMRFAQAVRGKMLNPVDVGTEAHPGDTVRLVAAADVRIGNLIVIPEGAFAQATVIKVKRPMTSLNITGLGLQLDWVEDVTGAHVPLRILPKGEPEPFMLKIISGSSGVVARPETLRSDLAGKDAVDFTEMWRTRSYIPAGTRLMVYVHGEAALDATKLQEAQDRVSFSQFETTANLMIYRTKGHGSDRARILCDGNIVGRIGERQYLHVDLTPGTHSCQVENQKPREITVQVGQEYFLHLQRSGSGWELKPVTEGEGEDSIENADLAPKHQN
jgi:hypothetical protein